MEHYEKIKEFFFKNLAFKRNKTRASGKYGENYFSTKNIQNSEIH